MFRMLIVTVVLCGAGAGGRGGPTRRRRKTTWSHTTRWFYQNYLAHSSFERIHSALSIAMSLGVTRNTFTLSSSKSRIALLPLPAANRRGGQSLSHYIIGFLFVLCNSARFLKLEFEWHLGTGTRGTTRTVGTHFLCMSISTANE